MKNPVKYRFLFPLLFSLLLFGCNAFVPGASASPDSSPSFEPSAEPASAEPSSSLAAQTPAAEEDSEPKDILILYTSDIHCGVNEGFGVVGLEQVRNTLESQGYPTLLVDNGDSIQGEIIGTLTSGESILHLMNELNYSLAVPGNHDFDYGADYFIDLTKKADFEYISCNFRKNGELVFEPYAIQEIGGKKIGFLGITTPETVFSSNTLNFLDEDGNNPFDFMQDDTGELLFSTVQGYVDELRGKGVDYVVVMAHLGNDEALFPFNYQTLIENTTGIDVILDGHSHDLDQVTMNDKDGHPVIRSACGTKLQAIGYLRIAAKDGSLSCGLYTWNNDTSAPVLFGITNDLSEPLAKENETVQEVESVIIGHTDFDLVIYDPEKTTSTGSPLRIVRNHETNLGDLCADALIFQTDADCAYVNGGAVRTDIKAGDISYGDIINVSPFSNQVCISEVTGQQILDCLEWGCASYPNEAGPFPQVSGITFDLYADVESPCHVSLSGEFACSIGERRVRNVKINGEDIDPEKKYRLIATEFVLKTGNDGLTMFHKEDIVLDQIKIDNAAIIDYVQNGMGGTIDEKYANPYGEGRINIIEDKP